MRRIAIIAASAALVGLGFAAEAPAATMQDVHSRSAGGCRTKACEARVHKRMAKLCHSLACKRRMGRVARVNAWRALVRPWRGWLNSTGNCESGSAGGYRLRTTGNGFWFRYQFDPPTWGSVGGHRDVNGTPVGMHGERVPAPLEQDVRAVRLRLRAGTAPWPVCG